MNTTLTPSRSEADSRLRQNQSTRTSTAQASPDFRAGTTSNCQAWVAKAANQPMALETVSGGTKLGYFWRFEIPGFVIRFLPNIDENLLPSSFIRQNARNRALSAPKSRRVAKSMPGFFRNFKLPDFHRFHAAGHI
jgi:hypothetical protein